MTARVNRRRAQTLLAAGGLLPLFAALPSFGQARPVLRAGDQKGGIRAMLEAADALQKLAYDIQWTEFPAAAPLAEALNAEAIDVGTIGDAPLLFALASGAKVKAFAVSRSDAYGTAVLARTDSPMKDAASLKGKRVATNRGSIGHLVTLRALASVGLKGSDVTFRFLTPPDAKLALTSGSVDAWATWEPYTALAEIEGHARVLVNGRGLWSGLSYLAATDRALVAQPEVLRDFAQRCARAQAWSYQNTDSYAATLARVIGISPAAAKLQFERRHTVWQKIDSEVIAEQQRTADLYLDAGLLRQRLDVAGTFDLRLQG